MAKVSVIIPVYNVEKYLERCQDSIVNQTHKDLEIILVDDGSTDGSGAIVDNYAKKDARIITIHKTNGGLVSARNAGLKVMTGEYFCFVDSDDIVENNYVEKLYGACVDNDADIAECGIFYGDKGEQLSLYKESVVLSGTDIKERVKSMFFDMSWFVVVWNKMYRSSLFADIVFDIAQIEDRSYNLEAFVRMQKYAYINTPLYHYRVVENSLSRRFHNNIFDILKQYYAKSTPMAYTYFDDKELVDSLSARWYMNYAKELCSTLYHYKTDFTRKQRKLYLATVFGDAQTQQAAHKVIGSGKCDFFAKCVAEKRYNNYSCYLKIRTILGKIKRTMFE